MSQSLYWKPVVPQEGNDLPDALKFKLRDKYDLDANPSVLGMRDVGYLSGLADCHIDGASELMEAIEKHGEVEVYLR